MPTVALTFQLLVVELEFDQLVDVLELVLVPVLVPPLTCVICWVGADDPASKVGVIVPPLVPLQVTHCMATEWYAIASPHPPSATIVCHSFGPDGVTRPVVKLYVPAASESLVFARASNCTALVSLTACCVTSLVLCASDTV